MPRDEQEPAAVLGQATELAGIVDGLFRGVAVAFEQALHALEERPPPLLDTWHVLEQDERRRLILPRLEREQ